MNQFPSCPRIVPVQNCTPPAAGLAGSAPDSDETFTADAVAELPVHDDEDPEQFPVTLPMTLPLNLLAVIVPVEGLADMLVLLRVVDIRLDVVSLVALADNIRGYEPLAEDRVCWTFLLASVMDAEVCAAISSKSAIFLELYVGRPAEPLSDVAYPVEPTTRVVASLNPNNVEVDESVICPLFA